MVVKLQKPVRPVDLVEQFFDVLKNVCELEAVSLTATPDELYMHMRNAVEALDMNMPKIETY